MRRAHRSGTDPVAPAPVPVPHLVRDGVTAIGYLALGGWAWFLYGFGALLPQLGREQHLSRSETALHSVGLAAGAMIAGALAVPLVRRLRRRGVLQLGCLLASLGVLAIVAGGSVTAITIPAAVLAGTGGSILVNTAVSTLSAQYQGQSASALAEGNALATGVGLIAPLAVGLGIAAGVSWRPAIVMAVPLVLVVVWLVRRQPVGSSVLDEQLPPRTDVRSPLPMAFWIAVLIVIGCVGVEFSMINWTAALLQERDGMTSGGAAAGVSAVIGGMAAGRILTGWLALRRNPYELLVAALLVAAAGWLVAWVATSPVLALPGLVLAGAGIGAHYPLSASMVLGLAAGHRDRAAGVISIGIGVASGGGPFVLGALADATSTHEAFLVVPALLASALVLVPISARSGRRHQRTLLGSAEPLSTGGATAG